MRGKNVIAAASFMLALIGALAFYSYYSPVFWLKEVKVAAQANDKDRLRDLIDFEAVKTGLKEDIKAQLMASMKKDLAGNPFASLGMAMASLMIDPTIDMIVTPSGFLALVEKAEIESVAVDGSKHPSRSGQKDKVAKDEVDFYREYVGFSRHQIEIWPMNRPAKAPIVLLLKREGLASWRLVSISLPSGLISDVAPFDKTKESKSKKAQELQKLKVEVDLQLMSNDKPNLLRLIVAVHNQSQNQVKYPAMDLILLDDKERVQARRWIMPAEYLDVGQAIGSGIGANAKANFQLVVDIGDLNVSGFRFALTDAEDRDERKVWQFNPESVRVVEVLSGSGAKGH